MKWTLDNGRLMGRRRRAISVYDDNSYLIEGNENKETGNKEIKEN